MNDRDLTITTLDDADETEITHLAQLDSTKRPSGRMLGARHQGRLIAAVSIETGNVIADPFTRTAAVVELLHLRRTQLVGARSSRLRLPRRRHGRVTLAGSPPGGGGRFLSL